MFNILLVFLGLGSIYALVTRVRDYFLARHINQAQEQVRGKEETIARQDEVVKAAEQSAQEAIDAYNKLKSDYKPGGSNGSSGNA